MEDVIEYEVRIMYLRIKLPFAEGCSVSLSQVWLTYKMYAEVKTSGYLFTFSASCLVAPRCLDVTTTHPTDPYLSSTFPIHTKHGTKHLIKINVFLGKVCS